jgi:hypothetical protein
MAGVGLKTKGFWGWLAILAFLVHFLFDAAVAWAAWRFLW